MARPKKTKETQEIETTSNVAILASNDTLESLESEIDRVRAELESAKIELEQKKAETKVLAVRPLRELDADEKVISDKHIAISNEKKSKLEILDKLKEYDNQKVTGKFMNRRAPGQPAKLLYQKHADDPVKWYTFKDGSVHTIPRGFADQINEHYYTPHFIKNEGDYSPSNTLGENSAIHEVDTTNKKYAFTPVNF